GCGEVKSCGRNIRLRAIEPYVALALLLGIIERMRVQEGPHTLSADIFEAEFKVRVLINGVMPAVVRGGANCHALLVGDFLRANQARRITCARRGNCRIEWMREMISKCDARRGRFNCRAERRIR